MDKGNLKKSKIIVASILTPILIIAWVILAFYSLNSITAYDRDVVLPTRFIAHRGYSSKYLENTLYAFNAASMESYFSGIETDIWQTKDGVFVCSHVEYPFLDKSIKIPEANYEEIASLALDTSITKYDHTITHLSLGIDLTKEYRICTLREYLSSCLVSHKYALIEIKQNFDNEQIEELLNFVKGKIFPSNVFFASFNRSVLEKIHAKAPHYKLMLFTSNNYFAYLYAELGYNIGVNQTALTEKTIKTAHQKNSYTFVYTVENLEALNKYQQLQVDFVICDKIIT